MTAGFDRGDLLVALGAVLAALLASALAVGRARRRSARWAGAALLIAVAAAVLGVVVEDVVNREQAGAVLAVDRLVRDGARNAATHGGLRFAAEVISRATGEGLVLLVVLVGGRLLATRRGREATVLLAGTLSAWGLNAALKLAFSVPRPHAGPVNHAISGYGFPSGHVLVTVVAAGLIGWALARRRSRGVRVAAAVAAAAVSLAAGGARLLLDAHWLSDVIAALIIGVAWLLAVLLVAQRRDGLVESAGVRA